MKALSIKQPWAWLIAAGHKDVENRSWNTKFRGKFLIHASKTIDSDAFMDLQTSPLIQEYIDRHASILPITDSGRYRKFAPYLGCIIGEAEMVDCVTESDSLWFNHVPGNKGFVIGNAVHWDEPVPYRGRLNFFEVDEYWKVPGE